jgi:signal transduction histidine kinase
MSTTEGNNFNAEKASHLAQVIDHINAGIWEFNVLTREVKWSAGFYKVLGYNVGEIECSYHFFIENLLYHKDKPSFLKAINNYNTPVNTVQIRLLTKSSGYQWFESTTTRWDDDHTPNFTGSIVNIHQYKLPGLIATNENIHFGETSVVAKVSGWEIDVASMVLTLSKEALDIYELSGNLTLSLEEAISFFEPAHRTLISEAIDNMAKFCTPFDSELLFRTAKNNVIWIRTKMVSIIDDYGKCTRIKGIFQDIDIIKKKEIALQSSVNSLNEHNKRLLNFTYIVSHNLRSHTGNLQFMVKLYNESESPDERTEVFAHINSISESLNTTIGHLNEIVKINTDFELERKTINFEFVFKNVLSALQSNVNETRAKITYDFDRCPVINYIPAYIESILQNLLTNALKYRHPDRQPEIFCQTFKDDNHICMTFEDNGIGIDLNRFGDKIFGLYKTFHGNTDALGIGLFITRNQIEALGGSIKIDSTVDVGTKFTIRLI